MTYDTAFYLEEGAVAARSAPVVLEQIIAETGAGFVIDVGCGTGEWAAAAEKLRCQVLGVDLGVPPELVAVENYVDHDLRGGYPCVGFDLAICVEVAEHLPAESAEPLVAGLAKAFAILFSAATPGQPGVGHINCQPHNYWHVLFERYGFVPTFVGGWFTDPVADFYQRNLFLYTK